MKKLLSKIIKKGSSSSSKDTESDKIRQQLE